MTLVLTPEQVDVEHLVACHSGAQTPWFTGSGWIEQMTPEQLERLHDLLHRQGESHDEATPAAELVEIRPAVCRKYKCGRRAARTDGLCAGHGKTQDRLRGARSA